MNEVAAARNRPKSVDCLNSAFDQTDAIFMSLWRRFSLKEAVGKRRRTMENIKEVMFSIHRHLPKLISWTKQCRHGTCRFCSKRRQVWLYTGFVSNRGAATS
ncbi:uncharacterized protein [Oscarella lobularis]|uniref:uncharacterized protein isoform X2 n=1 Tax=Oscarella lobularis TaxID=121494 RepID=UPI003313EBE5